MGASQVTVIRAHLFTDVRGLHPNLLTVALAVRRVRDLGTRRRLIEEN